MQFRKEIYLNGTLLGKLDGFMHRGHFNVTSLVNRDKENVLAKRVIILLSMNRHEMIIRLNNLNNISGRFLL